MIRIDYFSKKWKILVVDDSKLNRAIIKNTLSQFNMEIKEAGDGEEGLKELKANKFDLILVDIVMPKLDGFGFLSQYKNYIEDNFIPVILMTGTDDLNSKIKGLSIGADDFLLKPLNEKELAVRVLSLLRLKSAHDKIYDTNRQIKRELEIAKKVQQFIIPYDFSDIKYPAISGRYLPIEDIGGDYFDIYRLSDERYGFLIADVSGHGIPAALIMTMSKMVFNVYAPGYDSTEKLLSLVNSRMRGLLLDNQYVTSFYVIYDNKKKRINFTNAGHTKALFYRASGRKMLALDTGGFFIGISDESRYEEKSIGVNNGDRLFMYTDGITEIHNSEGEEYGTSRLARWIADNSQIHGEEFCEALLGDVKTFADLEKREDDIAFLNIEF